MQKSFRERHVAGRQYRIHHDQSGKALGHLHWQRKAEETAPVLHHQGDVGQVERADKGNEAVTMEVECVYRVIGGLVPAPATKKKSGDDAATPRSNEWKHTP